MTNLLSHAERAAANVASTTHGQATVLFEPTAARCSSSSSTCCILCVKLEV
ncbi:MAG: hypothetical protein ACK5OX_13455 [Desertimonas sp.]